MRVRKLAIEVEAFRWTGGVDQTEDPEWAIEAIREGKIHFNNGGTPDVRMVIQTIEGRMEASPGYWIVRGVQGEIYPVRADIFKQTYEILGE